jgi:hypothetical protein
MSQLRTVSRETAQYAPEVGLLRPTGCGAPDVYNTVQGVAVMVQLVDFGVCRHSTDLASARDGK